MNPLVAENAGVAEAVRRLTHLDLPALRAEWRRQWGEPPNYRTRDLLARAIAYRLQAAAFGDLSPPLRRKAAVYAAKFSADRTFTPTPGPVLKPGCSLVREWRGVRHEVVVTEDGFSYLDRPYRSLSQVAQAITGTKWNGLVFFGMKNRKGQGA